MALTYYPFLLANSKHQKEFHIIKKLDMKFEENQLTMSNKHDVMNIRQNVGPNSDQMKTMERHFLSLSITGGGNTIHPQSSSQQLPNIQRIIHEVFLNQLRVHCKHLVTDHSSKVWDQMKLHGSLTLSDGGPIHPSTNFIPTL
jgi:hypothetical protein